MAIEVKHGVDPAALAAVSFGGSQGATRSRLRAGMLAATEQRVNAERNREFISERDAEKAKVDQQNMLAGQAGQREMAERNREFISERDAEKAKVDQQNMLAGQAGQREMIDYRNNADIATTQTKFTDKQRQEFTQMNQAYEDARKSGDFSEPELKEIRKQIAAKQAMIEPLPELPEDRVDPWAQAQKKLFTDPVPGQRGYHKPNGDMEFLPDPVDAKREEYTKRYRELANSEMTENVPRKDLKGKPVVDAAGNPIIDQIKRPRTPAEINQAIQDEQAAVDAYMNPDAAAPTGKFVDANGDTSYVGEEGLAIQKKERLFMTLRSMDQRKLSPEAKAVLRMGEAEYMAKAQAAVKNKASPVYGMSVNDAISLSMSRIMPK